MSARQVRKIPAVEWITGLVSVLIVFGTLGYLVFEAIQVRSDEPLLSAHVLQVRRVGRTFVVDLEVRNGSRAAASAVQVAGVARSPDGSERNGQATIESVPGFSTRRVSLVFDVDPGSPPDVRIVGFSRP